MLTQLEMYQPQHQQQPCTTVLFTAAGEPVTLTQASQVYESYSSRQSVVAGIVLIVTGVMSIIFNAIAITVPESFSVIGQGIWCGVLVSKMCCGLHC